MASNDPDLRAPVLDPLDRNAEILFGVLMCLTFTGTLSVTSATGEDVRNMLAAAVGCNAAWGFVDAVMYLLRTLVTRGAQLRLVREVRAAPDPAHGRALVGGHLLPVVSEALGPAGVERIHRHLLALGEVPGRPALHLRDFRAAAAVFLMVFLSTFPMVLPFVLFDHLPAAMRASALAAVAILFACGYTWGRHAGTRPLRTGLVLVAVGLAVEAVVIALGG